MNALMAAAVLVPAPLLYAAWRFNRTEREHHHRNSSAQAPAALDAGPSIPAGRHDPTHPVVSANTAPQ